MNVDLRAASGLDVTLDDQALELTFGRDIRHHEGERRRLSEVRATLADPEASGLVKQAWAEL